MNCFKSCEFGVEQIQERMRVMWRSPHRYSILLWALSIAIPISAPPLRAASFDDDAKTLSTSQDQNSRGAALERIRKGGPDGVTALVKELDGSDPKTRLELIRILVGIRREKNAMPIHETDATELARQARKEKDRSMRAHLVLTLRDLGGPAAVKELERFAAEDPEEIIRRSATDSVAAMPGKEVDFFRKQTKDKSRPVQLAGYVALSELGDKSGREFALQTLKDSTAPGERQDAIWILGEIGNPSDSTLLKQIADSPTEYSTNRFVAVQASKTIELLQVPPINQLAFLMKALDDPSEVIRNWAGNKLSRKSDAGTKVRLKLYMLEPGHKGYKEAANAIQ